MFFLEIDRELSGTRGPPLFTPFIVWCLVGVISLQERKEKLGKSRSS
jgi:hypothetical protein